METGSRDAAPVCVVLLSDVPGRLCFHLRHNDVKKTTNGHVPSGTSAPGSWGSRGGARGELREVGRLPQLGWAEGGHHVASAGPACSRGDGRISPA